MRVQSIADVLKLRAEKAPDHAAFTFLADGELQSEMLTYGALYTESLQMAAALAQHVAQGDRIILAFPAGLGFIKAFFACQLGGFIPVPLYQPRNNRHLDRVLQTAAAATPQLILSEGTGLQTRQYTQLAAKLGIDLRYTDEIEQSSVAAKFSRVSSDNDIAFLQFTSGSTGNPKGVTVRQRQLLENLALIQRTFRQGEDSVVVGWLPHYHDMGLVGNILETVYSRSHCILMPPASFLQKPERWLQAIDRFNADTSGGPNFAYRYCAEQIDDQIIDELDLSSWKVAFCGAEPVSDFTMRKFSGRFSGSGFDPKALTPCYGMAEATLLISAAPVGRGIQTTHAEQNGLFDRAPGRSDALVSHGKPEGFDLRIVDQAGKEVPEGVVGEIWVRGESVASGYWENTAKSIDTFQGMLGGDTGPFLKTGDLGMLRQGELYICGRLDDQINLRGQNIYPEDIEAALIRGAQSGWAGVASFSWHSNGEEGIAVAVEVMVSESFEPAVHVFMVKDLLFTELGIHPSEVFLVRKGQLPRTTSGKIQRSHCKRLFEEGSIATVFRATHENTIIPGEGQDTEPQSVDVEKRLADIIGDILGDGIPGRNESLISRGLDSISITRLIMGVMDEWDIEIEVEAVFSNATIASLAVYISEQLNSGKSNRGHVAVEGGSFNGLSAIQRGMWFKQFIDTTGTSLHIPVRFALATSYKKEVWEDTLRSIIEEYSILRTFYDLADGKPEARYGAFPVARFLDIWEASPESNPERLKKWVLAPFDIARGPLLRCLICKEGDRDTLYIVGHHLILDGVSMQLILRRWLQLLGVLTGPHLRSDADHRHYVFWESEYLGSDQALKSLAHWRERLQGAATLRRFVPSHCGENISSRAGASETLRIDKHLFDKVSDLARHHQCTPVQLLIAAWVLLIRHRSQQDDIVIGMPVNVRFKREWEHAAGPFINLLLLRFQTADITSPVDLLHAVRDEMVGAHDHQLYPFDELVKHLGRHSPGDDFPLTRFQLNSLNFLDEDWGAGAFDAGLGNIGLDLHVELNCYLIKDSSGLLLRLDYIRELYTAQAVRHLLEDFESLLTAFAADGDMPLRLFLGKTFDPVDSGRLREVIGLSWGTRVNMPDETILSQFEARTGEAAHVTAVIEGAKSLTYGELDKKANDLASLLQERGIVPGDVVPLYLDKSQEYVIGVLAVLKCGGWFVPLDIHWPETRVTEVLSQLLPKLVVYRTGSEPGWKGPRLGFSQETLPDNAARISYKAAPDEAIYGIFTSGTTGKPKCAVNKHAGVLNRFLHNDRIFGGEKHHAVLCTARHTFDVSVWQLFWPLTVGGTAVIPVASAKFDLMGWLENIGTYKVTVSDMVPSVFNLMCDYLRHQPGSVEKLGSLEHLLIGGEMINRDAVRQFRKWFPQVMLSNSYGPTETAIGTVFYPITDPIPDPIPIGRPIQNVLALVMDEKMQPVAQGQSGEIHLGGICLGLGYFNEPELTAKAFVPDPLGRPGELLYRTGDWGYYGEDGMLYILGRKDDQVKVNGVRIECREIEQHLLAIPGVREAIVLVEVKASNTFLTGFYTSDGDLSEDQVKRSLAAVLPATHLPAYLVGLNAFPLTPNGKVDREALLRITARQRESSEATAPLNETEASVVALCREVLARADFGPGDDFFKAGGDSLKAVQLQVRIRKDFGADIALKTIYNNPQPIQLAAWIKISGAFDHAPISLAGDKDGYPLHPGQERIWIHAQLNNNPVFNLAPLFRIPERLAFQPFSVAVHDLLQYNEVLRARFFIDEHGEPKQVFTAPGSAHDVLSWYEIPAGCTFDQQHAEQAREIALRPFNLASGPLIRIAVWQGESESHILLNIHHIAVDGWSTVIIYKQLLETYCAALKGQSLVPPAGNIRYRDYVDWLHGKLQETFNRDKVYWQQQWEAFPSPVPLPADQMDKPLGEDRFLPAGLESVYARKHWAALVGEGRDSSDIFPWMLSLVFVQLSRMTGQKDLVVGVPIAGRTHPQLESTVGYFLNVLPIHESIRAEDTLADLQHRLHVKMVEALDHQEYPYERQYDQFRKTVSAPEPFQALCLFQTFGRMLDDSAAVIERFHLDGVSSGSAYPVSYYFRELDDRIGLHMEYNAAHWKRERANALLKELEMLLDYFITNPSALIVELPLDISADEEMDEFSFSFKM